MGSFQGHGFRMMRVCEFENYSFLVLRKECFAIDLEACLAEHLPGDDLMAFSQVRADFFVL